MEEEPVGETDREPEKEPNCEIETDREMDREIDNSADAVSDDLKDESPDELWEEEPSAPSYRCPKCNQPMTCTQFSYRPSWKVIMARLHQTEHGEWYEHAAWYEHAEWYES